MDEHIHILNCIDDERVRLGLSILQPVRIGVRNDTHAFAALSRNGDSAFNEGACTGRTLLEALTKLLERLRAARIERCRCEGDRSTHCTLSWARIGRVHRVVLPSGARGTGDTFRAALKAALLTGG